MNKQKWKLWAPLVSGYTVSMLCKFKDNDGASLPQRPPRIVFKIVWPILYLLLGLSWYNATTELTNFMHYVSTFLLAFWIYVYNCKNMKKNGIYIIAMTIASIISSISLHENKFSKILLTPLLGWLLIAYQLNWDIIK